MIFKRLNKYENRFSIGNLFYANATLRFNQMPEPQNTKVNDLNIFPSIFSFQN